VDEVSWVVKTFWRVMVYSSGIVGSGEVIEEEREMLVQQTP
jgi:hypothetical protein